MPYTSHRRRLDDATIETALLMREAGRGYRTIARQLGVSEGAIYYQCLRHGVVSPRQRRRAAPIEPHVRVGPTGRVMRSFTANDDTRLLELEARGLTYKAISREMGRAYTSVRMRLLAIAIREELPA